MAQRVRADRVLASAFSLTVLLHGEIVAADPRRRGRALAARAQPAGSQTQLLVVQLAESIQLPDLVVAAFRVRPAREDSLETLLSTISSNRQVEEVPRQ
jgi:hypothetical protein